MQATKKPISSLSKFIIFSFAMIIIYTIVVTVLTTITGNDYSQYYTVFVGLFGCSETLGCAIIKVFKLKQNPQL